ncbi:MAG TPA: Xaa-Pro peptidase family protein [Bacillota bacterium]
MATHGRVSKVAQAVGEADADALVLIPGANLYYALGQQQALSERPSLYVITAEGSVAAALPELEVGNARQALGDAEIFAWSDAQGPEGAVARLAEWLRARCGGSPRLAVEYLNLRLEERELIVQAMPGAALVRADGLLGALRSVKDADELEAMRRAARIAEDALEMVLASFREGMTERQLANALKAAMLELGTEALPKEPVVSSGPRTAYPHTKTTDRPIRRGDAVMIDTGARWNGYCSDITRTFFVGAPPAEFRRIYEAELQANRAVVNAVRPGITLGELDDLAHRAVEEAGLGAYFPHRVGHGLGLEGHEPPYLVSGNEVRTVPGMTFTIEPGIYHPEHGGVRIEDNVAVGETGSVCLTSFPRELRVL